MQVAPGEHGSPVSDDGRGLKLGHCSRDDDEQLGSPVSDDGRGLKQVAVLAHGADQPGSPVSDDGRGLKQTVNGWRRLVRRVRPSVMTGVD